MNTLAADFGGRRIKLGLVTDGKVAAQEILPAIADQPLRHRLDAVAKSLRQLCDQKNIRLEDCKGIGVSYPSVIDTINARITDHFGKFGDASSFDFRQWAEQQLRLPLAIDNDARMALIGEWIYGNWNSDNMVLLTIGTGLGVATVIQGQVLRGAHGQAGILGGHITVQTDGRACVCGNIGCAEAEASTSVLEKIARKHPEFQTSALANEAAVDYGTLFRLASGGDACAKSLVQHTLNVWSALAVSLIHAFDPDLLVLSGGVMGSSEFILPTLREYVNRHAHTPWGKVRIEVSLLRERAALLACEWLVSEQLAKAI